MSAQTIQTARTTEKVVGALSGLIAGYVLWLVAITVGDELMTVSQWSWAVLVLSGGLAVGATLVGLLMRWRRKYGWSLFSFGLLVLPVALSLGLLAELWL